MSESILITSESPITDGKKPWYMWELEKQKQEIDELKEQFAEYVKAEDLWRVSSIHKDRFTAAELREKAIKTLGL